jgi:hypothetical protein
VERKLEERGTAIAKVAYKPGRSRAKLFNNTFIERNRFRLNRLSL